MPPRTHLQHADGSQGLALDEFQSYLDTALYSLMTFVTTPIPPETTPTRSHTHLPAGWPPCTLYTRGSFSASS